MQVENLGLLATLFDQDLHALAMTALTLVKIKFARKSKQLFHCLATGTQPKSTQLEKNYS